MNEEEKNEQVIVIEEKRTKKTKEQKKQEKLKKKEAKKLAGASNDGKIIAIIVASVILVALSIFGYFMYNKSLKPVVKYKGGLIGEADYEIYYKTFSPMLKAWGYDESGIATLIAEKAASDAITVAAAKKVGVKISAEDKTYVDELFSDEEQTQLFKDAGIDPIKMKQFYYNDYIMDAYIDHQKQALSADEVRKYITDTYGEDADMREYVTNHILLFTTNKSTGEKYSDEEIINIRAKAQGLLDRALNGEDFETLAKENSEDGTAADGGKYKVYIDGNTVDDYKNAVLSLTVGNIYPKLVETTYGFHIIKLSAYNENGRVNSDTEREKIVNDKINKMIEAANIEVKTDVMNEIVKRITGTSGAQNNSNSDSQTSENKTTAPENTDGTVNVAPPDGNVSQ